MVMTGNMTTGMVTGWLFGYGYRVAPGILTGWLDYDSSDRVQLFRVVTRARVSCNRVTLLTCGHGEYCARMWTGVGMCT